MASSFTFFGGVPQSVLLDNMKLAVVRIRPDGTRERTAALMWLISHYLFKDRYGQPGRGNDTGNVEALVRFARHAFLTPVPNEPSFAALNATLERHCLARLRDLTRSANGWWPIWRRSAQLPSGVFEGCDMRVFFHGIGTPLRG